MDWSQGETQTTLISTYEEVQIAAATLAKRSNLVLDIEGKNPGMADGVLSILSLGDPSTLKVYLFDALALGDKHNSLLSPLFALLRDKQITKLVWDGRGKFVEIADTYGVLIDGIVDVQLAEVMARPPHKLDGSTRARQTISYFKSSNVIMTHIAEDPSILEGIHRVMHFEHCTGSVGLHQDVGARDRT